MSHPHADLRQRLRRARRDLSPADQTAGARAVVQRLAPWFGRSHPATVGAYLATDGEVQVAEAVDQLRALGWVVAYPRIGNDTMTFHTVDRETDLVEGRWGLREPPVAAPEMAPHELRVVLTPLVAFDSNCNRVGRGKAYYDRAFAFLLVDPRPQPPLLVG
ncbi:MAG: 5-formyltetrahydrofolate cyclo-ligase, partial [Acidimicrobiales bacterium]